MTKFICKTCGVQFEASHMPPDTCPICEDERQYLPLTGQAWTTHSEIQANHKNEIKQLEPNLYSIKTTPKFAIGQQAHLIVRPSGNILWDCVSLLDEATIEAIKALGGIKVIALSHPHYYSSMLDWAQTFDAELLIHEADKQHVTRQVKEIRFWKGETFDLDDGATLVNAAGHFDGGTVLYVPELNEGKAAVLSGDIIQVVADPKWVSFMYSYPNSIPLSAKKVQHIMNTLEPFTFERLYGAFGGVVQEDAKNAVELSAKRYIAALNGIH